MEGEKKNRIVSMMNMHAAMPTRGDTLGTLVGSLACCRGVYSPEAAPPYLESHLTLHQSIIKAGTYQLHMIPLIIYRPFLDTDYRSG